ncbi:3D domain-containing protein [Candidatus Endomicrobiellum trichonymphae]|uniref:3D-domain protein n=1 Tax=Endomicrobium trichonymphae TaxID=1408204 RepID=B1H004_ENDTX|nr:3D domain-containing protein [Candidatus Endomicrobium trichonymphae]BAG13836.1 3D-domain protein [Candidatus Endomicrobium trichonymphae]
MNIRFFVNILKLSFIALGILVLASIFSAITLMFTRAYINTGEKTYTVKPYKNISLKTVLDKNGIFLNDDDIVSHDISKPIKPLQTVKIIHVTKEQKKIIENTPFKVTWSRKYNSNLRKVELQKGKEKNIIKTINKISYNGILYNTNVVNEQTMEREYSRLVLFKANNAIEKVYDLSKAKKIKMVATAYYPGDPLAWKDGTITFLGQKMQRGIVAVDPNVIPLKTRLFIPGYGYGYAGDKGSLIRGKRIDLGVNNAKEEKSWRFKDVNVYILEKSDKY